MSGFSVEAAQAELEDMEIRARFLRLAIKAHLIPPLDTMSAGQRKVMRKYLRARDGDLCGICGEPMDFDMVGHWPGMVTIEHKHPRKLGGTNEPDNLMLAHQWCNQKRDQGVL